MASKKGRYRQIIEHIFFSHFSGGLQSFTFSRNEIDEAASELGIAPIDNRGDLVYTYRYRQRLPPPIRKTCPSGFEWIIKGKAGSDSEYTMRMVPETQIRPQPNMYVIKVPDATPEIVTRYARSEEQALLAKLRYNRLIDIFTGITTYSLQNHLRTQVDKVQIEIDEVYLGVGKSGTQFILPVQAKTANDKIGRVQLEQDLEFCQNRYPELVPRAIAAQIVSRLDEDVIALFELTIVDDIVHIVEERQYKLVLSTEISSADLDQMRSMLNP